MPTPAAVAGWMVRVGGGSGGVGQHKNRIPAAGAPFYVNTFEKVPAAAALTALGRDLFSDPALSASGKISCASCHDPKHAFGPPNDLPVQRGGGDGRSFGVRAVPSLMYTQNVPPFTG